MKSRRNFIRPHCVRRFWPQCCGLQCFWKTTMQSRCAGKNSPFDNIYVGEICVFIWRISVGPLLRSPATMIGRSRSSFSLPPRTSKKVVVSAKTKPTASFSRTVVVGLLASAVIYDIILCSLLTTTYYLHGSHFQPKASSRQRLLLANAAFLPDKVFIGKFSF